MKKIALLICIVTCMIVGTIIDFEVSQETFGARNVDIVVDSKSINNKSKYLDTNIKIPKIIIKDKNIEQDVNKKIEEDIMNVYKSANKEAENFFDNFPDLDMKFIVSSDFKIKKDTKGIISILVEYYRYSGGAHGYNENVAYNIDITTGEFLDLDDIFKANSSYKDTLNKNIQEKIQKINVDNNLAEDSDRIYNFKGINDNQKFYLQDGSIVIFFDLYEIAPYVAGIPEFLISTELLQDEIKDEYKLRI